MKLQWLNENGYVLAPRHERANTAFDGKFMVIEQELLLRLIQEPNLVFIGATHRFCVVGDSPSALVAEAFDLLCPDHTPPTAMNIVLNLADNNIISERDELETHEVQTAAMNTVIRAQKHLQDLPLSMIYKMAAQTESPIETKNALEVLRGK